MLCNRGIYHKGWTAVTKHRTPWQFTGAVQGFDEDVWELYDTNTDWTQARDLAQAMPDKLRELQRLWLIEAVKYNVLPLDDRLVERFNADIAGRPQLVRGDSQLLFGGMGRLSENSVINIKNKSHSVTAEVEIPAGGAQGVIIAQGGAPGGWSLYAHGGKLKYCYNVVGRQYFYVESADALPAGNHQVRMEFAYDGGGLAKGGNVALYVDGQKAGEGRVEYTTPFFFSLDEGCDIGWESGSPVSPDYGVRDNAFNGEVHWVQIDVGKEDFDHLISPEERLNLAMMRQ
jgi:arylsulfatase